MVIVTTYKDDDGKLYMDHGYDVETGKIVVLSQTRVEYSCYFDIRIGEWILK